MARIMSVAKKKATRITAKQRVARVKNIAKARMARERGSKKVKSAWKASDEKLLQKRKSKRRLDEAHKRIKAAPRKRARRGEATMDSVVTKKGRQRIMGGQNKTNKWLRLVGGGWYKNF